MESDSKPRIYSHVGEKLVSETSVESNCQQKTDAVPRNQTKVFTVNVSPISHKTLVSVKIQNLLVIQVNNNMICFPCYCLLVYL